MSNCTSLYIRIFERSHFKNHVLYSKEIQGHFYYKNIVKNCTILNKKKRNECFSALLVVLEEQLGGSFAFLLVIERATKVGIQKLKIGISESYILEAQNTRNTQSNYSRF